MSGGRYNYLFTKEPAELLQYYNIIEWCESGDSGEDGIKYAVEEYRNRGEENDKTTSN